MDVRPRARHWIAVLFFFVSLAILLKMANEYPDAMCIGGVVILVFGALLLLIAKSY